MDPSRQQQQQGQPSKQPQPQGAAPLLNPYAAANNPYASSAIGLTPTAAPFVPGGGGHPYAAAGGYGAYGSPMGGYGGGAYQPQGQHPSYPSYQQQQQQHYQPQQHHASPYPQPHQQHQAPHYQPQQQHQQQQQAYHRPYQPAAAPRPAAAAPQAYKAPASKMPSLPPPRKVEAGPPFGVPFKPAAPAASSGSPAPAAVPAPAPAATVIAANPAVAKLTADLKSSSLEEAKKPVPAPAAPAAPAPAAAKAAAEKKAATVATEAPKREFKSRIANVVVSTPLGEEEMPEKEHINILFMGHVDAGKSTMGGHLLFLTGMVDKRTMEKYEKEAKELGRESWYLSWALDLNSEERNKGKTTEYGRGFFETSSRKYTILDAPGHKQFVPSMIGASAQADVGVLVISARKGEFETGFERGGQTREHAMLAKTSGVKRMILVINKMDDPSVQWSKERYDEILAKLLPFLKGVGYSKGDIDVMPVSGYTGANLKDRLDPAVCSWHTGPSLIELLDSIKLTDRHYDGAFMMPIADKMKDMGTLVTGKIESGKVRKGQSVLIMPNKQATEVLAILQEDAEIPVAVSGDNVRIRLKNVEEEDISAGFVLCTAEAPVQSVMSFEAQLSIVEYKSIICSGYTAVLHAHTAVEEVSLTLLHKVDKKTGRKSKQAPQFVRQGDACIARIDLTQYLCMEAYADYPQLGRFTLRDEGKTVAIGKVVRLLDSPAPGSAE